MLNTASIEVSVNLCWRIAWRGKNKSEPYLVLCTVFFSSSSHCLDLSRAKWTVSLVFPEPVVCFVCNSCSKESLPRSCCLCCSCRALRVPALCAICAQVRVTARAMQIYVLIAWERAGSPVCALPYPCSRSDTSQVQCVEHGLRELCDTGACFPKSCFSLENLDYEYESQTLSCCVKEAYYVVIQLGAFPNSSSLGVELGPSHRFRGKERG